MADKDACEIARELLKALGCECSTPNPGPIKEPWQMTQQEWSNRVLSQQAGFVPSKEVLTVPMGKRLPGGDIWAETGKIGEYKGETTYYLRNVETGKVREFPASELSRMDNIPLAHEDSVKLALSEGKPVPAEVLKDYPDLIARDLIAREVKP